MSDTKKHNFMEYHFIRLLLFHFLYIGAFRNSQSDVILAHAPNGGCQRIGQPHRICKMCVNFLRKMGFYSQSHFKTCLCSLIFIQNASF